MNEYCIVVSSSRLVLENAHFQIQLVLTIHTERTTLQPHFPDFLSGPQKSARKSLKIACVAFFQFSQACLAFSWHSKNWKQKKNTKPKPKC